MTSSVEDLLRRALVMRRIRAVLTVLVPVELLLYVPPPRIVSPLRPIPAALAIMAALLLVVAASAAVHRRVTSPTALMRWGQVELAADAIIALVVLQLFAFDQFSAIWTILVIVVLEGAFRAGVRGAVATWLASYGVYTGIQLYAARVYPDSAPLDIGSIVFRAMVVGSVAVVAGQLASQLEAAVERHRRSEQALAEQYADLKLIGRVSRAIAAGPEARADVCQAVAELSGASVVMLYEPVADELRGTAVAGCPLDAVPVLALSDPVSGSVEAFHAHRPIHRRLASVPPSVAAAARLRVGRPTSTSFVPVRRDGEAIGVLALVFGTEIAELPARVGAALEVMAEEAAVAIARADAAVQLAEQARRDPLTGLRNRRGWEETLGAELARAARSGAPLSMLMLDLDGLKTLNDTLGHQAGDQLLVAVARSWESRLRPTDVLARYGGDEFVVVLPGCDRPTAHRVAEGLLGGLPAGASCTAGVAEWDRLEDAAALVERADAALYVGKHAGGGRVVPAESARPAAVPSLDVPAQDHIAAPSRPGAAAG